MKNLTTILIVLLTIGSLTISYGQNENEIVDEPLGLRIKKNGQDYLIYADQNLTPVFEDYRKINYRVFFRKVNIPIKEINGIKYQLISIPGSSSKLDQHKGLIIGENPRSGKSVDKEDYDQNFWIEEEVIEKYTDTEYYKYANDFFSGLLTAPFKYRLKTGDAPEALFDGDFNVAPFLGWKFRVSSARPYYIAPYIFTGITTLNYNSANNSKIEDEELLESGAGITYGLGLSFTFGNISPGIVLGFDKGLGNLGSGFLYSNKPWISFSINYDFFKPKPTSEGQN